MKPDTPSQRTRPPRMWVPYLVLAAVLLLTGAAALYVSSSSRARDRLRFENAVQRTEDDIRDRLDTYVAMLRAGSGLFTARGDVTREEFRAFVGRLELQRTYPGIQGVGFSLRVPAEELDALAAEMRRGGFEDFRLRPDTSSEGERHAIIYLEPLDRRNRAALGFDMFSEPVRREAMRRACDTGGPAASGRVTLVQESEVEPERRQAGFLIYAPVYRGGATPATVEERRALLRGFVYSPFRADDLLRGIFGREPNPLVNFSVYDGPTANAAALLHTTHQPSAEAEASEAAPRFRAERTLDVAGRPWTLVFTPRPGADIAADGWLGPAVMLTGVLVALALYFATRAQARARSEAEQSAENFRASEARFRTLVEQSPVSTQIFSPDGRTVRVNRAWEELWGVTLEQLGDYNILADPQLEQKGIAPFIRRGFEGEVVKVPAILYDPEETIPGVTRHKDPRRWVQAVIYPVRDERGRVREVVLMHEDITERTRTAEQLLARAQELAEANRLKDEFLATLSHELRTPLTSVLGWAKLLRAERLEPEMVERALEAIERNAQAQTNLINDLLDVSRIVTGKLRLSVRPVELAPIVEAAVESLRPAAEARGVLLRVELDARLGPVSGDADRLQQVAWNLLSNAIKFTPRGGRVGVRLAARDGHAELTVSDTGRGISPEFLPYVFERFRQADGAITREHGGLGLGLSIARHLIELHGGTVRAESEGPGRGAVFTVRLPLQDADSGLRNEEKTNDGDAADDESAVSHPQSAILSGLRVLVVDDEEDSRLLLSTILQQAGAEVAAARSAAEAFESLTASRPDVLVADIGMPVEDGYGLIRRVRALPPEQGGTTPAAALTAYARPEDEARALEAGYQLHIPKPIDPSLLADAVARLVGRQKDF